NGAGANREHGSLLGTRKVSGRIPDGVNGDHRAEGAEQRDRGESACSCRAHECCRSGYGVAGQPEPDAITQAKACVRSIERPTVDQRTGKTTASKRLGVSNQE